MNSLDQGSGWLEVGKRRFSAESGSHCVAEERRGCMEKSKTEQLSRSIPA